MRTVNLQDAKSRLSELVDQAASGEPFIIVKAGKPMVRVVPLDAPPLDRAVRTGFMTGQIRVPDDFDRMGADEIEATFEAR